MGRSERLLLGIGLAATAFGGGTAAAQPAAGEPLFRQRCGLCHAVDPGKASPLGPNLAGVVGRKAASTAFAGYSPALRKSALVWTPARLDAFLTAPAKLVPGTRMVVALPDKAQRAAVIAWLASRK